MPLYEYECSQCRHRTEVIQRFGDPPLETCPECGGKVRKLFSAPAVQFKGSGWYVTDYGNKGKQAGAATSPSGGDKEAKKSSGDSAASPKSEAKSSPAKE